MVNDTFGHMFGDEVLVAFTDIIKKAVGRHGVVGRIGGDEIMIVTKDIYDKATLRPYLREIRTNMEMMYKGKLNGISLTCQTCTDEYIFTQIGEGFRLNEILCSYNHGNVGYRWTSDAEKLREKLTARKIESVLFYRLIKNGKPDGFIMFAKRHQRQKWSEYEVRSLSMAAKIFELSIADSR